MLKGSDSQRIRVVTANGETLRCAETVEPLQPLNVTSRPLPEVPDEGVLLRTLYAGICRSDVHFIDDETKAGNNNGLGEIMLTEIQYLQRRVAKIKNTST